MEGKLPSPNSASRAWKAKVVERLDLSGYARLRLDRNYVGTPRKKPVGEHTNVGTYVHRNGAWNNHLHHCIVFCFESPSQPACEIMSRSTKSWGKKRLDCIGSLPVYASGERLLL